MSTNTNKNTKQLSTSMQLFMLLEQSNKLPNDTNKRINMLTTFYEGYSFIQYDNLCEISSVFSEKYNINYIRSLLRKYNVIGKNLQNELDTIQDSSEEKIILKLFFKGKADIQ